MPPAQKKFVKYTFDGSDVKPREQPRPSRQNFKQRDSNTQTRRKSTVSYTQKPASSKQNGLKDMIASFISIKKASPKTQQLMKKFPKFFTATPKEPQPYSPESLNSYLTIMGKKHPDRQARNFVPFEPQSESDPDWDSDSDVDGCIESKKIDEQVVEKTMEKLGSVRQLRLDELKRHEKQFLEDYYKQKHQEQLEKQKNNPTPKQDESPQKLQGSKQSTQANDWTDYQQKQVKDFVNMGIIQKIEEDQNDFSDDDFSVEDEKSQSARSQTSSEGDDDIFGDEGPTTIVKKKQVTEENSDQKAENLGRVVINSHVFSRIAEMVGIPPGACIWIIRNKTQRYKVSTQFMDQMYRLNNFCESLPYVSLNHSEFVHNHDVQKEKGLQIFKKFNARKQQGNQNQGNHHHKAGNGNVSRNYDNKNKYQQRQYKPNTQQVNSNSNSKTHINKK